MEAEMESESPTWTLPAEWPSLGEQQVHVWLARAADWQSQVDHCSQLLAPDEKARAARFRHPESQRFYALTRGILRLMISRYTGIRAIDVAIKYGEHGKPELNTHSPRLHFNVSHAGEYAAFAFTWLAPVGVDIERVRLDYDRYVEIAERHFSAEEAAHLRSLAADQQIRGFFRFWAHKEAFVKARGDGVFGGLNTFAVDLASTSPRLQSVGGDAAAAARWSMHELPAVEAYACAVAVAAPQCALRCFKATTNIVDNKK
jgi:4'-phosphopantetheinyl transferase